MTVYKFEDIATNMTQKRKPSLDDMQTYIGLEHLDRNSIAVYRWGSSVPIKGDKLIMHAGDVLFGKRNAYLRRASIAPHDGLFSAHGMVLKPNEKVISKALFPFFVCSDYFFDAAIRISVGSLSPTINWSALKQLEFNLPDMQEQEMLAELLWAANDTKEKYKKLLQLTDDLVNAQFTEMFGDISSEKSKYELVELAELCKKDSSNIALNRIEGFKGEYPLYGASGLADYIDTYKFESDYIAIIKDGAGVGRVMSLPAFSSVLGTMQYIIPNYNCELKYLEYVLIYLNLSKHATGSTIPHIYFKDYSKKKVPNPPIHLQKEFASIVMQVERAKYELQQNILSLENAIKSIMRLYTNK